MTDASNNLPKTRINPPSHTLAVDLDDDGVETINEAAGNIFFDYDGNGFAERTGWICPDDGVLVRDLNQNGLIDNGTELFGNQTILSDGEKATNGFEALADLDSNQDGVFDYYDSAYQEVLIWQDKNQNGLSEYDELLTLEKIGIAAIDLDYKNPCIPDKNANRHNQKSFFTKKDATTGMISGIWFNISYIDTIDLTDIEIPASIKSLPNIKGFGNVHDLHISMALDATDTLKNLVEQYIAETNPVTREVILINLIYAWTGVIDVDPESRASNFDGNAIRDARKLETLEAFFWGGGMVIEEPDLTANEIPTPTNKRHPFY